MASTYDSFAEFFKILADPTRLAILEVLKEGEKTPKEIQDSINKSQSTVSQQLKILTLASILISRKDGVNRYYRVRDNQIFSIIQSVSTIISKKFLNTIDQINDQDVKDILL